MKLFLLLTLLVSLVAAVELVDLETRQARARKKTSRPKKFTGVAAEAAAARRPSNAPDDYKTSLAKPSRKRAKSALGKLPADLIDPLVRKRFKAAQAAAILRRQLTAQDFYECQNANPAPRDADCNVVIDNVYNTGQSITLAANNCLTFSYRTCTGFFCSLCTTLQTTTDFIGNQLSSAESLCVKNGQEGTIVGEDPPQWDAGFVREGNSLPTYDVC